MLETQLKRHLLPVSSVLSEKDSFEGRSQIAHIVDQVHTSEAPSSDDRRATTVIHARGTSDDDRDAGTPGSSRRTPWPTHIRSTAGSKSIIQITAFTTCALSPRMELRPLRWFTRQSARPSARPFVRPSFQPCGNALRPQKTTTVDQAFRPGSRRAPSAGFKPAASTRDGGRLTR